MQTENFFLGGGHPIPHALKDRVEKWNWTSCYWRNTLICFSFWMGCQATVFVYLGIINKVNRTSNCDKYPGPRTEDLFA